MNKKIILGLASTALLASTLFAYGNQSCANKQTCNNKQTCKQDKMHKSKGHSKHHKSSHHKGEHSFMKMVMHLDLSDKQKEQITSIMKEGRKSMPNPSDAFTESSFDKTKYITLSKAKKEYKVEHKANMIEKVYGVLTAPQKKDLKTMLDMKRIMKKKMMQKKACHPNK